MKGIGSTATSDNPTPNRAVASRYAEHPAPNRRSIIAAVKRKSDCPECGKVHRSLDSAYNAHSRAIRLSEHPVTKKTRRQRNR